MSKPTQRTTKARTRSRRSHHALKAQQVQQCTGCDAVVPAHQVCQVCGQYKGKQVLDVKKRLDRRAKKLKALS